MKSTLEELLFAAAVRQRVGEMRNAKVMRMSKEKAAAYRELPGNDLIEEALKELEGFAQVIAQLRAQPTP